MALSLVITHLASYRVGETTFHDALAETVALDVSSRARYFLPGYLPCGECGQCRRAIVGACASALRPLADIGEAHAGQLISDLPTRFLTPLEDPVDAGRLPLETAAGAGLVAFALFALASANVAPGDVTVWVGKGPLIAVGAALSRTMGANEPNASEGTHGTRKQIVFVVGPSPADWALAATVAEPGATIVQLGPRNGPLPAALVLPTDARLLHLSAGHPDFLPEALAALRRKDVAVPTTPLDASAATAPDGALVLRTVFKQAVPD